MHGQSAGDEGDLKNASLSKLGREGLEYRTADRKEHKRVLRGVEVRGKGTIKTSVPRPRAKNLLRSSVTSAKTTTSDRKTQLTHYATSDRNSSCDGERGQGGQV